LIMSKAIKRAEIIRLLVAVLQSTNAPKRYKTNVYSALIPFAHP
jgi:hypothetical protein